MNGICAGGTGSFIDQMASLIQTDASGLNEYAKNYKSLYTIAARCGVFAKTDIQPLINEGATKEDLSASIFQAVVNQTISGLACGKPIRGHVAFLGGPLHFLSELKTAFIRTLNLDDEHIIDVDNSHLFAAIGSALNAKEDVCISLSDMVKKLSSDIKMEFEVERMEPLFADKAAYQEFVERHSKHHVTTGDLQSYQGKAFLGIDAGSTTTKIALVGEDGSLLYSFYSGNDGSPLKTAIRSLKEIYSLLPEGVEIVRSCSTGYGEALMKAAFLLDDGEVETVAHYYAAAFFDPSVDCILDIGGQDMKCIKIKNQTVDSVQLNEACSSGCGSFIQAFAVALGYDIAEFSKLGLFAEHPVDLGSRCTVFMNSSVKQAQKDGATVEDISAGLSGSIVKNAIYKVIRARNPEELGQHIVVQGGTFLNDAVLRCFEREIGHDVIRPAISGLMGAFGAALYAQEKSTGTSTLLNPQQLQEFSYTAKAATCKGCTAHCALSVIRFNNGGRFISGNRCEKGAGKKESEQLPNLYEWKYRKILSLEQENQPAEPKATVGLPLALHYYDQMPLWHTFFTELGFAVKFSEESTRGTYYKGQSTIPSDTVCYPAKLTHGHIESLLEKGVDFIFYPCMSYNIDEGDSDNHFNCPVVAYYPELLMANCEKLNHNNFLYPFLDLNRRGHVVKTLSTIFSRYATKKQVETALEHGFAALEQYRKDITAEGEEIVRQAREAGRQIIVLAGRPYHIDPEINHGIHKLIGSLGLAVITEDSVAHLAQTPELQALNQWTYHSRMYRAAKYVTTQPDMQLVQLVSFGCGIDAITTDEVRRILETGGKLYTQLKIDEISNLGAIKIRLRSLIAAMEQTQEQKQTEPETA